MIIEFQTSSANVLQGFHFALGQQLPTIEVNGIIKVGTGEFLFSKVELDGPAKLSIFDGFAEIAVEGYSRPQQIAGQDLNIEQRLSVQIDQLNGTTLTQLPPVSVRLGVTLTAKAAGPNLAICFEYGYLQVDGTVPGAALSAVQSARPSVQKALTSMCTNLPFSALIFRQGSVSPNVANSGLACLRDLTVIGVRVEFGELPLTTGAWEPFCVGDFTNRVILIGNNGRNNNVVQTGWAHFMDHYTVETAIQDFVDSGLTGDSSLQMLSGVGARWSAPGGSAQIDVDVTVREINACSCFGFDSDIDLDFTMNLVLSVPADDQVLLQGSYGYSVLSTWTEICCVTTGVLTWPFLVFNLPNSVSPLEWFSGLMQGPIILAIGLDARIHNAQLNSLPPACQTTTQWHFECTKSFAVGQGAAANLIHLTDWLGLPEGLVMLGSQLLIPEPEAASLGTKVQPFKWTSVPARCSDVGSEAFKQRPNNPFPALVAFATVSITNSAGSQAGLGVPLIVHSAVVIADTLNVFDAPKITGSPNSYDIDLVCGYPTAAYWAAPYPCVLLVQTSAGAQVVTVPGPPLLSEAEAQKLVVLANAEAISECLWAADPWWQRFHRFNLKWSVDPGEENNPGDRHLWEVLVAGVPEGEGVQVMGPDETIIGEGIATSMGRVEVRADFFATHDRGITLVRKDQRSGAKSVVRADQGGQTRMYVAQSNILQTGLLDINRVRLVAKAYYSGEATLACVQDESVGLYRLRIPGIPQKMLEVPVAGARGVTDAGSLGVLVWGEAGLARIHNEKLLRAPGKLGETRVDGVVRIGDRLYVLNSDGVEIIDSQLRSVCHQKASLDCPKMIDRVGNLLIVQDENGMRTVDTYGAVSGGRLNIPGVTTAVGPARSIHHGNLPALFIPFANKGGVVVEMSRKSRAKVVARYEQDPLWFKLVRFGQSMAYLTPEGRVAILRQGKRRIM